MSKAYDLFQKYKENYKENIKLNKEYPVNVWTIPHNRVYNEYFSLASVIDLVTFNPEYRRVLLNDQIQLGISGANASSYSRRLLQNYHIDNFLFDMNEITLSNIEKASLTEFESLIGSRFRFYIPLFDKNEKSPWVMYADPTVLFLENPRSLIKDLDPTKMVHVCKHPDYTPKSNKKTSIESISYPFADVIAKLFEFGIIDYDSSLGSFGPDNNDQETLILNYQDESLKKLFSIENFENYNAKYSDKNLSLDEFMKVTFELIRDKKNFMIRNKPFALEERLEQIYERWYVSDTLEQFDNIEYSRKNWSSFMIFNKDNFNLKFNDIHRIPLMDLHQFTWCDDSDIGELPLTWNHLVDEQNDNVTPKALNYTLGFPSTYDFKGTSKFNKKFNNINIAYCMGRLLELNHSTVPRMKHHTYGNIETTENEVPDDSIEIENSFAIYGDEAIKVLKETGFIISDTSTSRKDVIDKIIEMSFDELVKPILNITEAAINQKCDEFGISNMSPIDSLSTAQSCVLLSHEDVDAIRLGLTNSQDLYQDKLINFVTSDLLLNPLKSKKLTIAVIKELQNVIKKLTLSDKEEILNFLHHQIFKHVFWSIDFSLLFSEDPLNEDNSHLEAVQKIYTDYYQTLPTKYKNNINAYELISMFKYETTAECINQSRRGIDEAKIKNSIQNLLGRTL